MSTSPTSTRPANVLMAVSYAVGALGFGIAFSTLGDDPPSLTWASLITVGAGGIIAFVRHALFHRADAERMGWTGGESAFQIEVGLANLAWGVYAVLAVVLDWGLRAEAAGFLVFGLYMGAACVFHLINLRGPNARPLPQVIPSIAFAALLLYVGFSGMSAAG